MGIGESASKKLLEAGKRVPTKDEFVDGFKYSVRGFKTGWKDYIFPDKPEDMDHHPADTFWVVCDI